MSRPIVVTLDDILHGRYPPKWDVLAPQAKRFAVWVGAHSVHSPMSIVRVTWSGENAVAELEGPSRWRIIGDGPTPWCALLAAARWARLVGGKQAWRVRLHQ